MKYNELFPTEFNSNPKLKNRFFNYYKTFFKEVGIKKKMRPLKYLSLFTGIGGFEVAIQSIFPNAECIGYSEIKKSAIEVYNNHFPGHKNLGNVTEITKEQIQELVRREGCDLIVGGFPCTNLSSIARTRGNGQGLDGPKSGLFWTMIKIMEWIVEINKDVDILVENNGSMKIMWREIITNNLKDILKKNVYINKINADISSYQKRNRIYWSTFSINITPYELNFNDILEDIEHTPVTHKYIENSINGIWKGKKDSVSEYIDIEDDYKIKTKLVKNGKTRLSMGMVSNINDTKSRPIVASARQSITLIDGNIIRKYSIKEILRLFNFPDNYIQNKSTSVTQELLGNSLVIFIILRLLNHL